MPVITRQIGPCFAAEVEGIDMTKPLTPDEAAGIHAGMDQYAVLVFHDQHGEVRVFLGVVDGEPILGLRDHSGTQRAMVKLGKADGTPSIFVTDTDGNILWHAP